MKKWLFRSVLVVLWLVSLVYAYGLGGLAGMYAPDLAQRPAQLAFPLAVMLYPEYACNDGDRTSCGFQDTSGREQVNCEHYVGDSNRRAVLFVFGQSNSANAGNDRYTAERDVANFNPHDGRCYRAVDPLLGPNGSGGSVWGLLGDQLIDEGHFDSVLIVPFGIGGTDIARWIPGGDLHVRVKHAAETMAAADIEATHVLWHQGESDVGRSSGEQYTEMFSALADSLRGYGVNAPIYPAVASICSNTGSDEIRAAQMALPEKLEGVYAGANTDTLSAPRYRYDNCHFSAQGMRAHANLWVEAITRAPR